MDRVLKRTYKHTGKKLTRHEVIVAYLWEVDDWIATEEVVKLIRPYGVAGSEGAKRLRELVVNDCALHLQGKVEKATGKNLGLDPRYTYWRYKTGMTPNEMVAHSRDLVKLYFGE